MSIAIIFGILNHLSQIFLIIWGAWLISSFVIFMYIPSLFDISLLLVFAFLKAFSAYIEQLKNHDVAFKLLAELRTNFYKNLAPLAPAKLIDKRSGDIISTIGGDIEIIEVFFAHTISPVVIAFIISLLILIILGFWWILLPFILLPFQLLLGLIIPLIWGKFIERNSYNIRKILGETNAHLTDSIQGLKTILLFNYGKKRLKEINEKSRLINKIKEKNLSYEGWLLGLIYMIIFIAYIIILIVSIIGYNLNILDLRALIVVIATSVSSFGPLIAISSVSHILSQTFAAAKRLFKIIDEKPEVIDITNCLTKIPSKFDIEFKNVSFKYNENSNLILENFNLKILHGTKIALIGPSGCGKSTVLRLLVRFWDVQSGEITINGINIKNFCQNTLRKMIALIPQNPYLFDTTIKDNIAIGNPNATFNEIIEVAKAANIYEFIMSLPKKYDTPIGELGNKLSGGEKQRIAICRALLKNSPIILLDEPTSNLDTINEGIIQETLNNVFKDKTVIIVAHRLSTIAKVDSIYYLNYGKCQNIESCKDLIYKGDIYMKLLKKNEILI